MKASYKALAATFGMLGLALLLVPHCSAQCGGLGRPMTSHSSWQPQPGQIRLLPVSFATGDVGEDRDDNDASIVGFWHVKFVSKDSKGVPDGTEVDAGYAQWHSDGTEIMNSGGRPPSTGDFCLGVWKKVGVRKYKLNHFAASWDSTGSHLLGPANIREEVTLDPGGKQFTGTFTIDQYDEVGNTLAHVQGVITGTRITVETPAESIF